MRSSFLDIFPHKLERLLKKLGADLAIARKKRHLSIAEMCERTLLSKQTYQRVEKGDPTVSLGAIAMCLFALGEERRIGDLIDAANDDTGLLLSTEALPKRIRRVKPKTGGAAP
jgi:transcriptional regulator with XRE-family HTH domain